MSIAYDFQRKLFTPSTCETTYQMRLTDLGHLLHSIPWVFSLHDELHHIKKENIGLLEMMRLAILPARLKEKLTAVAECLGNGFDLRGGELTAKHADCTESFAPNYAITAENTLEIVKRKQGWCLPKRWNTPGFTGGHLRARWHSSVPVQCSQTKRS